ncbi:MAG: ATP-binding protein [Ktedonobacterales bacterium]
MAMPLLERDAFLHTLEDLLCQVQEGSGRIALVSGEAGIGKTSLVEGFLQQQPGTTRVLWGTCEALFTPRPLGPLYDFASQTDSSPLRTLLQHEATPATLFAAVQEELQGSVPTLVVLEDIHWADEATLDLVKFLARRIHRTRVLLILTYRDDELSKDHALRLVLGDLPARVVTRLHLPPLSEAAVAALVQPTGRSAGELYAVTGGNPFFLIETLASDAPGVPGSVADAVLAQVVRRSPEARRLLELVAVVPSRTEGWVVEAAQVEESTGRTQEAGDVALEECLVSGLLRLEEGGVRYRHELARQAVEDALSPARRRALHAQVLHLLLERGGAEHGRTQVSLARLVHHAAEAEEAEWVLRLAPEAARQASAQGAHRAAAAHYRSALGYADSLPAQQRAQLLDELADECSLSGRLEEELETRTAALAIWRDLKQPEEVGRDLCRLSHAYSFLGRSAEAERSALEAVELLEPLPPSRELARAYANLAGRRMVQSDSEGTQLYGTRAIELAELLQDEETICSALNSIGSVELDLGNEEGYRKLERSLQLALTHGFERDAALAYNNLAAVAVNARAYDRAAKYLGAGLLYCVDHDLEAWEYSMRAVRAQARLDQGDWSGAAEEVTAILSVPDMPGCTRTPSVLILGQLRARRGDPGAAAALDEAQDLALASGEMQHISPVAAARAEWRWLLGDIASSAAEAEEGFPLALRANYPWCWGQVAIWLWRSGRLHDVPERTPEPFALQMSGDWRGAAAAWKQLGCPYEQALALMDGDEAAQRQALDIFERLGARPAAARVRRRLHQAGVRRLPRGPRPATLANPRRLTNRQLEILRLLAEGLHNAEIADRLSTTPKTVEQHVSAVLAKLGARSRAEAVRLAYER